MRILFWLIVTMTIAGCSAPLPALEPAAPMSSPVPNAPRPDDFRKLGPDLRRHLLQRGRQALRPLDRPPSSSSGRRLDKLRRDLGTAQAQDEALEVPETLSEQLRPVTVVIQARRDITEDLEDHGVRVRSVTQNGIVVITADVPPAAIPSLLILPDLETIELTQPVPPAAED